METRYFNEYIKPSKSRLEKVFGALEHKLGRNMVAFEGILYFVIKVIN